MDIDTSEDYKKTVIYYHDRNSDKFYKFLLMRSLPQTACYNANGPIGWSCIFYWWYKN